MSNKFAIDSVKEYITIVVGLALYALGWTGFLLPHEITTGGVTGIGALLFYAKGIPVAVTYLSINLVLLFLSVKIIGWKFSLRTIFGVGTLTIFLTVAQQLITKPILVDEPFMACVLGGVFAGVGIGIVFTANGSTGGTDIIAMIVNKYRNITLGRVILYSDLAIIASSFLIFHSLEKVVFGVTTLVVMTYCLDLVVNGVRQSVQFFIFTHKPDEIAQRINIEVHRGVT
ncbi:MAG: YitT family protein, partial [Bacteroidales bacterium]|nr:YitT family protein [Bacteroidales bacterium]